MFAQLMETIQSGRGIRITKIFISPNEVRDQVLTYARLFVCLFFCLYPCLLAGLII